jgi:hypothetical protein
LAATLFFVVREVLWATAARLAPPKWKEKLRRPPPSLPRAHLSPRMPLCAVTH